MNAITPLPIAAKLRELDVDRFDRAQRRLALVVATGARGRFMFARDLSNGEEEAEELNGLLMGLDGMGRMGRNLRCLAAA